MAWVTPPTFASNATPTAAQFDIISNDLAFLYNPPTCRIFNPNNQTLVSGVSFASLMPSEDVDTDTMHSTSVNTERITFNTAGRYFFTSNAVQQSTLSGVRTMWVQDQAANVYGKAAFPQAPISVNAALSVAGTMNAAATQFISQFHFQNSGSNMILVGFPSLAAVWTGG